MRALTDNGSSSAQHAPTTQSTGGVAENKPDGFPQIALINRIQSLSVMSDRYEEIQEDCGLPVEWDDTENLVHGDCSEARTEAYPAGNPAAGSAGDNPHGALESRDFRHDHCHRPKEKHSNMARNQLIVVSILCFMFMIAEIVGGLLSNSLALVTDATHMASDLAGFLVSLLAIWLATKPATHTMSFGFHRAEVVGALVSVLLVWVVTGVLVYLAVKRVLDQSYEIKANEMLIVSALGVFFNIVMGLVLHSGLCKKCSVHTNFGHGHSHGERNHSRPPSRDHSHSTDDNYSQLFDGSPPNQSNPSVQNPHMGEHTDWPVDDIYDNHVAATPPQTVLQAEDQTEVLPKEKQNINVRAAMVHVIGDFVQSIGVLIAATIIKIKPEYKLADPLCTFVFSVLVLFTTVTVLRDVIRIFMEGVPREINFNSMKTDLEALHRVRSAHSLNVWALTAHKTAVAVHLAIDPEADWNTVLKTATSLLRNKYDVHQSTIQVELYDENAMTKCDQCIGPLSG